MDLVYRAVHGLPLTPAERATYKALTGILITALIAALGVGANTLSGSNPVVLTAVAGSVVGAFLSALLHGLAKYFTAQGDVQAVAASVATEQLASALDNRLGLNAVKVPDVEPTPATPQPAFITGGVDPEKGYPIIVATDNAAKTTVVPVWAMFPSTPTAPTS